VVCPLNQQASCASNDKGGNADIVGRDHGSKWRAWLMTTLLSAEQKGGFGSMDWKGRDR
jgi:hypothetical protein